MKRVALARLCSLSWLPVHHLEGRWSFPIRGPSRSGLVLYTGHLCACFPIHRPTIYWNPTSWKVDFLLTDASYFACLPLLGARHGASEWQNPLGCGHHRSQAGLRQRDVLPSRAGGGGKGSRATTGKQICSVMPTSSVSGTRADVQQQVAALQYLYYEGFQDEVSMASRCVLFPLP